MKKPDSIHWLSAPEPHDYPAAVSYLSLLYPEADARKLVDGLQAAPVVAFKSKDIFRASGLSLLGISNGHVQRVRDKIQSGEALSPVLLVRDAAGGKVVIADGYHRLCAVYQHDEDAIIPCQIV